MDALLNDLKYGLRTLRRSPGSTLVALLTLGIAIGLATSVFSLVNAIALRPLPYSDPRNLYELRSYHTASGLCCSVSGPDAADWRAGTRTLSEMVLFDERTYEIGRAS